MYRWWALLLILIGGSCAYAQNGQNASPGAFLNAIGGNGSTMSGVEALFYNQAGLTSIADLAIQANSEQRFLSTDIRSISLGLAKKLDANSTVGLMISTYGFQELKEQKIGLVYARKIDSNLSIGGQFNYNIFQIQEYGSKSYISFELGLLGKLSHDLTLGAHISNPAPFKLSSETNLNPRLGIGLRYDVSSKTQLYAGVEKEFKFSESVQVGVRYALVKNIEIMAGINSSDSRFSFGFKYNLSNQIAIAGAASNHQYLGITPAFSLSYDKE